LPGRLRRGHAAQTSLLKLAEALAKAITSTAEPQFGPPRPGSGGVTRRLADITAAEHDLG
jgi:UDP-glucose 4-epimerase